MRTVKERTREEAREERRGNHRDAVRERRRQQDKIIREEIGLELSIDREERSTLQDISAGVPSDLSVRNADRLAALEFELEAELDDGTSWVELLTGEHLEEVSDYYGGTGFCELKIA